MADKPIDLSRFMKAEEPKPTPEAKPTPIDLSRFATPTRAQRVDNAARAQVAEENRAYKESFKRNMREAVEGAQSVIPAVGEALGGVQRAFQAAAALNLPRAGEEALKAGVAGLSALGAGATAPLQAAGTVTGLLPTLETRIGRPLERLTAGAPQGELRIANPLAPRQQPITAAQMRQAFGMSAPLPEGAERAAPSREFAIPYDLRVPREFTTDVALNVPLFFLEPGIRQRSPAIPAEVTYAPLDAAVKAGKKAKERPPEPPVAQPAPQPPQAAPEPPAAPAEPPRQPTPPPEPPVAPRPPEPTPAPTPPAAARPTPQAPDNWPADVPRTVFHGYGRPDRASVYGGLKEPILGPARYSAFDKADAAEFGPNVVETQATARNPLVIRNNDDWKAAWGQAGYRGPPMQLTAELLADLRSNIEQRGHDGVIVWFDPMADVDAAGKSTKRLREAFGGPQVVEFGKTYGPLEAPPAAAAPPPRTAAPGAEVAPEPGATPSANPVDPGEWDPGELQPGEAMAITPEGSRVRVKAKMVELDDLLHAEGIMQNRNRDKIGTDMQVQNIIADFDPERLGPTRDTDRGPPIISGQNVIESGNGRVMALRKIYEQYPELETAYRDYLKVLGYDVDGMRRPVLVRERMTPMTGEQRARMVRESNKDDKLRLSTVEQAANDAELMTADVMQHYRGGDLFSAANRPLVQAFMAKVPVSESGALFEKSGELTVEGARRLQSAMLARAYSDSSLLTRLLETRDNNIKSIGIGLMDNAGNWAALKDDITTGRVEPHFDVSDKLVEAAKIVSDYRAGARPIQDWFDQIDAFSEPDPIVGGFIRMFYNPDLTRAASQQAIANRVGAFVGRTREQLATPGLFGDVKMQPRDIMESVLDEMMPGGKQDDIFAGNLARRDAPPPGSVLAMMDADPARRPGGEAIAAAQREAAAADPANQTASFDVDIVRGGTGGPTVRPRINRGQMTGEARPDPTRPTPTEPLTPPRSIMAMAADMSRIMGLTVRQGRGPKGRVLGFFKTTPHVIRMQELQDFDVRAHEAGHHMEFAGLKGKRYPSLKPFFSAHQRVLQAMSYPGVHPKHQRVEGFAEFFRVWLTNPDELTRDFPGLKRDFEAALQADAPKTLEALQALQTDYQAMIKADPVSLGMSAIAKYPDQEGFVRGITEFIRDPATGFRGLTYGLVHGIVDNLHPIKLMMRQMIKVAEANIRSSGYRVEKRLSALNIEMADDPYYLMKAMPGAVNRAYVDVARGVVPYRGTAPEGPSLIEAMAKAEQSAREWKGSYELTPEEWTERFDSYLNSRNMIQQWRRHLAPAEGQTRLESTPDRMSPKHHLAIIEREEAAFPGWVEAAEDIYAYQNNMWRKLLESGRMDREVYQQTMRDHPDYVPAYRSMEDITESLGEELSVSTGMSAANALEYYGRIARFKGSRRDVLSPTRSIFENTVAANIAIAKNDVNKAFMNLTNLPGAGAFVEVIPAKTSSVTHVSAEELAENVGRILGNSDIDAKMLGIMEQALAESDGFNIYRSQDAQKRGEQIIHAWVNGTRVDMRLADGRLGRDAYNAIAGLDKLQSDFVLQFLGVPALVLRLGITQYPTFFIRNIIADAISAASLTNVGVIPYVDTAKGLFDEIRQTDIATRYRIAQGLVGGEIANVARNIRNKNDIGQLKKAGYNVRSFTSVKDALRAIPTATEAVQRGAEAIEMGETANRLAIFKKAEQKALERGLSPYDAMFEAAMIARAYMDFDAHGANKWIQGLSHVTPFLNASINGLRSWLNAASPAEVMSVLVHNTLNPTARVGLSEVQQRQAAMMRHVWMAMGIMAGLEMTLRVLNHDNPVYDETTDLRRLNWVIPTGEGDEVWLIPKPFELALMGNLMSRFYEGAVMGDPRALTEAGKDAAAVLIPPVIPQSLKMYNNLATNRDDFGNAIIPESKKDRVLPADQYGERTSKLAIWMGQELNVSPAQIDYVLRNVAGYASRDLMNQLEAVATPATGQLSDVTRMPILSRFVKDPMKNMRSSRVFWGLGKSFGGEMTMTRGSFHAALQQGDPGRAQEIYNDAPPYERSWIMLTAPGVPEDYKKVHPMHLYPKVVGALGDMATDLAKGDIVDAAGQQIMLTAEQRQDAVKVLNMANGSMKVNALRDIGAKGYEDAPRWPQEQYLAALYGIDPRLYQALNARVYHSGAKVTLEQLPAYRNTWLDVIKPWSERALSRSDIEVMAGLKQTTGKGKELRALREVMPAR